MTASHDFSDILASIADTKSGLSADVDIADIRPACVSILMDKLHHWRRLDELLTSALDTERHRLRPEDAEVVQHYMDHNEYGLAYERLYDAINAQRSLITAEAQVALKAAADLMNL